MICFPAACRARFESRRGEGKKGVPRKYSCFYELISRIVKMKLLSVVQSKIRTLHLFSQVCSILNEHLCGFDHVLKFLFKFSILTGHVRLLKLWERELG